MVKQKMRDLKMVLCPVLRRRDGCDWFNWSQWSGRVLVHPPVRGTRNSSCSRQKDKWFPGFDSAVSYWLVLLNLNVLLMSSVFLVHTSPTQFTYVLYIQYIIRTNTGIRLQHKQGNQPMTMSPKEIC